MPSDVRTGGGGQGLRPREETIRVHSECGGVPEDEVDALARELPVTEESRLEETGTPFSADGEGTGDESNVRRGKTFVR